jgi:hypothetical protein
MKNYIPIGLIDFRLMLAPIILGLAWVLYEESKPAIILLMNLV